MKNLLKVENLNVKIKEQKILNNLNLSVDLNEIHAIVGPNGSGKSTFSKVLMGYPEYQIETGNIYFLNENLLQFSVDQRAKKGLFLAFQQPLEISGITNFDFLHMIYNKKQKNLKKPEIEPFDFFLIIKKFLDQLKMPESFLYRNVNENFSGGEKKKNEILQLCLLEPKLVVLDEIDSGLDIDALKLICDILKNFSMSTTSFLIITHYFKILEYLKPTSVHIFAKGQIIKSGDIELVKYVEKNGYEKF